MYGKELEFSEKVFKKENGIEDNEEDRIEDEEEPEPEEKPIPALVSENSRVSFKLQDDVEIITPREEIEEEMYFPKVPESDAQSNYEARITKTSNNLEESHPIPLQVA